MIEMSHFCRWFLSDAIVPGNHGTQLRLDGLDRSQNGAIVKCEVSNAIGKSEETQTLDIFCEWVIYVALNCDTSSKFILVEEGCGDRPRSRLRHCYVALELTGSY